MSGKNVVYRSDEDILYINLGEKSHESIPRGGFIIDLDSDGRIAGIELLDAAEMLESLDVENVEKFLSNLVDGDIILKEKMGVSWIILKLYSKIAEERVEQTFRFEVPSPEVRKKEKS